MEDQGSEVLLLAVLNGGPDDDAGSVAQGVRDVSRQWSSIGTLQAPPAQAAPDGARSGELATIGAVCATVLPLVPDLIAAFRAVFGWIGARPGRTATVVRPDGSSIELTGLSAADQHALIQDWIGGGRGSR
jgi:hypothetical protein